METTVCIGGHWTVNPANMTCRAAVALIVGGQSTRNVETYSPYGLCSQALPSLSTPRSEASLDLVGDKVILCGGIGWEEEDGFATCLQMNMSTYTWGNHSDPPLSIHEGAGSGTTLKYRSHHSSLVHDNSLILLGGLFRKTSNTDEVWDGDKWKLYKTTPYKWIYGSEACTVKVNRDTYIIMGGYRTRNLVLEFHLSNQTFTDLPNLNIGRTYHACTLVKNSTFKGILLSGGTTSQESSELYDLSTKTSIQVGNLNIPRFGHIMMVLGEKIVAMGGSGTTGSQTNVEEFDLATQTWSNSQYHLGTKRWYAQATAIPGPDNKCCDCYM